MAVSAVFFFTRLDARAVDWFANRTPTAGYRDCKAATSLAAIT